LNESMQKMFRPFAGAAHSQLRRMRISPLSNVPSIAKNSHPPLGIASPLSPSEGRARCILGFLPKRISLPENLEFKPQMLLNLKQSMHVEKRLVSGGGTNFALDGDKGAIQSPPMLMDAKQVLKSRLLLQQQQRMNKAARMQLMRQQVTN